MQSDRDAFLAGVAAWSSAEVWLEASNLIAWLRVTCETKQRAAPEKMIPENLREPQERFRGKR
jgi:hypothetical protein